MPKWFHLECGARKDGGMKKQLFSVLLVGLVPGLLSACVSFAETPGERFQKNLKEMADLCQSKKLIATDSRCILPKIQPADPLATEEGRFAHSIKIPNPVPADSGYKPGMTPEQYFDYLCKTEAGEFIFKTVENVEGIIQLRPRVKANYEYSHLYAFEDPFGFEAGEGFYVGPGRYTYYEISALASANQEQKYTRYFGYDGRSLKTLQKTYDTRRKSRYGYIWRGIARPHDRENGIGGGEVIVLDLETNAVLGVQRGYAQFEIDEKVGLLNAGWRKRCPLFQESAGPHQDFILKVLKPGSMGLPAEGGHDAAK
jgi:hypothetical protein